MIIINTPQGWHFAARTLVKTNMSDQFLSYTDLAQRLNALGVEHPGPLGIKNKINRGTFSAAFLMQVYWAMEIEMVDLKGIKVRH